MGKLVGGPFGMLHGRVGNLVAYVLNGENVMRQIGKSNKPLTKARKANCEKMAVVNRFLQPALDFIRIGFRFEAAGTNRNAYNEAVSYNKMNALRGEYPNISMDYSKVLVSKGNLPVAQKPKIERTAQGVVFTWDTSDIPVEQTNDRAMLLVSYPEMGEISYHPSGARRMEGKDMIPVGWDYKDAHMEVYISFINPEGTQVSDSVYVGTIEAVSPELQEIENMDQLKSEGEVAVKENRQEIPDVRSLALIREQKRLWFLEALKNRTAPS